MYPNNNVKTKMMRNIELLINSPNEKFFKFFGNLIYEDLISNN